MKSAGKRRSNASVWCGEWYWANGIEPESNQTSITSGDAASSSARTRRTGT